jgi:hypothetical protein
MKLNKKETTQKILAAGVQRPCIKLELRNIVYPKWSDMGLDGLIFRQCLKTKEQPTGNIYDEAVFQTVLRIIGGKVLISGRPDCYCWKFDKLEKAKDVRPIGTNSAMGLISLAEVLDSIPDMEEKTLLASKFADTKRDLMLVTTAAEDRVCIEVTMEMAAAGITHCVDEWMKTDENGNAEATAIYVGDYLIVTHEGIYRVGRDEFAETYQLA